MQTYNEKITFRATIEPFKGLRLDLTANRSETKNLSEFYIAGPDGNLPTDPSERGRRETGNFSMSYISWKSAFESIYSKNKDFDSESFIKFKEEYRIVISERLANQHEREFGITLGDSARYREGFGPNQQQVLISAFLAAYGLDDPNKVTIKSTPSILEMRPNWRLTFDGLSRIDLVKRYFNNITLSHAYRSSYNIGSWITNPGEDFQGGLGMDVLGNFIPEWDATAISINEQFSPLFDINMDWKNSLTTRVEFKRQRTLALSTSNNQINEVSSKEIVIGAGYRFKEVQLIINQNEFNSDLNLRTDLSIKDNRVVIRKLAEDVDQITAGQRIIAIKMTLDYVLSDRFNLRFFFDQRINKPFVSLSYPTSNTNIGFSVRFTLAN
jgi:cell surface protein SprA